jgi:N2-acetyl-L-2,4-diaminobutanoate deacetylase
MSQAPLEVISFMGLEPGPRLIVIGAVHGNETCGPQAIKRLIGNCRENKLAIVRGRITFVPVANHKAYFEGTREGDRNLNRDLREYVIPQCHEDRVANLLCALLREHDVVLDIHSFRTGIEPFVFVGPPNNNGKVEPFRLAPQEEDFAAILGPSLIVHGWLSAFARAEKERVKVSGAEPAWSNGVGTTEYMRRQGGYGATIECGSHRDPGAAEVAYTAVVNAMAHLCLIDAPAPRRCVERSIEIVDAVLCLSRNDRLEKPWATGEPVARGGVIARRANGNPLTAPRDGFVIFPNANPKPFTDLYQFGIESGRFGERSGSA